MNRLSEEQLDNTTRWARDPNVALHPDAVSRIGELVRGYRHAAALEAILREWVQHTECMHDRYQDEPCADCIELAERSRAPQAAEDDE